jgi:hypothetical protein
MPTIEPDYTFERCGRSLADWLWQLLAEERSSRDAAAAALQAMQYGVPSVHTELNDMGLALDMEGQRKRFAQAVRETVQQPGFDTADFVTRLCVRSVALHEDWLARCDRAFTQTRPAEEQWERISQQLVVRINTARDESVRKTASKRLARALCAVSEREGRLRDRECKGAEAMSMTATIVHTVFEALDTAFLAAPEALALVLEHSHQYYLAFKALERMGSAARMFAPRLLERIDKLPESKHPSADEQVARALGAVGKGDSDTLDALLARTHHEHFAVRNTVLAALGWTGVASAGRPAILARLQALLESKESRLAAIEALASVGRASPVVRLQVIALAWPRPPQWEDPPPGFGERYDAVMVERGVALGALRHFNEYAEECLPVLLHAIDSFEEFDPDECYDGPVGRVARVLGNFGPAAAPAAAVLARKAELAEEGDFPRAILHTLVLMGTAAAAAVEPLTRLRARPGVSPELPDLDAAEPDKYADPVGWVIRRIRP